MSIKYHKSGGVILYQKFEELLVKSNKTAYQVSKDTGISTSTLSNWKHGNYTPKVDKLKILADYFGVTVDYLLKSDEEVMKDDSKKDLR